MRYSVLQGGQQWKGLPLRPDVVQAAQTEAPEPSSFFDLSEDRLDDRLPHLVNRPSGLGAQFAVQIQPPAAKTN